MSNLPKPNKQKGAVTLLMAMVMLIIITAVTIAVGKVALTETKLVSDEEKRQVANLIARSATDMALLAIEKGDFSIISGSETWSSANDVTYKVMFCDPQSAISAGEASADTCIAKVPTESDRLVLIAAKAEYDGAAQYINSIASYAKELGDQFDAPVITGNVLDVSGSATIKNATGRITAWSGSDIDVGNGNSTELTTIIAAVSGSGATVIGTTAGKRGIDIIDKDSKLGALDSSQMFESFFGMAGSVDTPSYAIWGSQRATESSLTVNRPSNVSETDPRRIYIDGDLSISGNDVYGAPDDPIILVINGDFSFTGGAQIYGIVFVAGNLIGGGNGTCKAEDGCYKMNGGILVAGSADLSGNFGINFDQAVIGDVEDRIYAELVAGAAKDWREFK